MPKFNLNLYIISSFLLLLFSALFPLAASAHVGIPSQLVPCGLGALPDCRVCHLYDLAHNVIDFLLWGLASPLLVVALIASGIIWLTSAGSEEKVALGRRILFSAVIGFLIAFAAWVIVNTILNTLVFKNPFNQKPWSDFSFCENAPFGEVGIIPPPPPPPPPPPDECRELERMARENPIRPSAELNTLISCAFSKIPASLLSRGNIATVDSVALCNTTKGDGRCNTRHIDQGGICHHSPNSCHYYGEAVDFNAPTDALEGQLYAELVKIASACNFGPMLFENKHTHVSTRSCAGSR